MPLHRFKFQVDTEGNADLVDLTAELNRRLREIPGLASDPKPPGLLSLFVVGSTAALTTIEFEVGLVKHDLPALLQRLAPSDGEYQHEATWHDDNGHSHLQATLLGPSLTVPVEGTKLLTGEWQQIVLVDLDTRARKRTIIATLIW